MRQNEKRAMRNRARKNELRTETKKFLAMVHDKDVEGATSQLSKLYKKLDQVSAKGTLHSNTASRKKSRLAKRLTELKAHL